MIFEHVSALLAIETTLSTVSTMSVPETIDALVLMDVVYLLHASDSQSKSSINDSVTISFTCMY